MNEKEVFIHEPEAVKKIKSFFEKMHYTILPNRKKFGVDIKAVKNDSYLYCEVKGTQNAKGRKFTPQQNEVHFATALEQICRRMEEGNDRDNYMIAFPYHKKLLRLFIRLKKARKMLYLKGLFLMDNGYVKMLDFNKDHLTNFKD